MISAKACKLASSGWIQGGTGAAEIKHQFKWIKTPALHIPSVLATHLIERVANLPQRMGFDRFHEPGK
jgi:hypothetical protein